MNSCVHGVIGVCIACTIAAAMLPFHVDRDDHDHTDPAPTAYVGSAGFAASSTALVAAAVTYVTPLRSYNLNEPPAEERAGQAAN